LLRVARRLVSELSFIRGNLLVLIVTWVLMHAVFGFIYPFESPYVRELGASPLILGMISSIGMITLCLVYIPGSYIADKYGRRQIIVTMTYAMALSYAFYAFAPCWRLVLAGAIIGSLCLIYRPALNAIQADSIPPDKRGMGFAVSMVVPMLASSLSPTLSGIIVGRFGIVPGMRMAYTAAIIVCLIAAAIRTLFLRETLHTSKGIELGELKGVFRESLRSILEAWKLMPKDLLFLTIAIMIYAFGKPIFIVFSALYVMDVVGASPQEWGLVNTGYVITAIAGIPLGKLVDFFGRRKSILLAYMLFIPSTFLFILSRSYLPLLTAFIVFSIAERLLMPALGALQADMIPRDKRGRIMGSMGILNTLAMIPGASIGGFLYEIVPAAPFIMKIFLGIASMGIVAMLVREPKEKEE